MGEDRGKRGQGGWHGVRDQGGLGVSEGDGCVYMRLLASLAAGHVQGKERWPHIPQVQGEPGWEQCVVGGVRGRPRPDS